MIRLIRPTIAIILTLAGVLWAARQIGAAQPVPPMLSVLFTNPDGSPCERPCMFGVRPGKMTRAEAEAILKSHPALRNLRFQTGNGNTFTYLVGDTITVALHYDVSFIGAIFEVSPLRGLPAVSATLRQRASLGDTVTILGAPDYLQADGPGYNYSRNGIVIAYYLSGQMQAIYKRTPGLSINADSPLIDLIVYAAPPNIQGRDFGIDMIPVPWRGFSAVSRYPRVPYADPLASSP